MFANASVRTRILRTCLAIVVAALAGAGAANYHVAKQSIDEEIVNETRAISQGHVTAISDWVLAHKQMIASLESVVFSDDPRATYKLISHAGSFVKVYSGYPDRSYIFSHSEGIPSDFDPTVRPWYRLAVKEGGSVVTSPFISASTGKLVVAFASPIFRDNRIKAVIAGDIDLDIVIGHVKSVTPTPASFAMLVDTSGKIVASPDVRHTLQPVNALSSDLSFEKLSELARDGRTEVFTVDGRKKLILSQRIPGTGWLFIVALDKVEATAMIGRLLWSSIVTLLIIAFVAVVAMTRVTRPVFKRLNAVRDALDDISSGNADLTQRLVVNGNDEVGQIAAAFNRFSDRLNSIMHDVRHGSLAVKASTGDICLGNMDLSRRTEDQALTLERSAISMNELTNDIFTTASNTREASKIASCATHVANESGRAMGQVVDKMNEIRHSTEAMSEIIRVIEDIAFQTNILALNASVEAARAGREGMGFSVVASEVRRLAHHSAGYANEIKLNISASTSAVEQGSALVHIARKSIDELGGAVNQVTSVINEIANAAERQSQSSEVVNKSLKTLDGVTQQNAALVQQSAAASAALEEQARNLDLSISVFKLRDE